MSIALDLMESLLAAPELGDACISDAAALHMLVAWDLAERLLVLAALSGESTLEAAGLYMPPYTSRSRCSLPRRSVTQAPWTLLCIEQWRLSSENLQKSIMYTLCSRVPQVAPTFGELFGVLQALTVAQVLLIDIGTAIWTAIAYAVQPAESLLMQRNPRHPRHEKTVNAAVLFYSCGWIGQLQMLFCWLVFFYVSPGIWTLWISGKSPADFSDRDLFKDCQGVPV